MVVTINQSNLICHSKNEVAVIIHQADANILLVKCALTTRLGVGSVRLAKNKINSELLREKQRVQREGLVIREITNVQIKIPDCCRLQLPSCTHGVGRPKRKRYNIGL